MTVLPKRIRQIFLMHHPGDTLCVDDMAIEEVEFRSAPGDVVTRTTYISVDPYLSFNMSKARAEGAATPYPMRSRTIGEVIDPGTSRFQAGDSVLGFGVWRDFDHRPAADLRRVDLSLAPPEAHLGVLGHSGFTAWLGLYLGQTKAGQTILISGAGGAVGSTAGVLARRMGCRVVGIAGGKEKGAWLRDSLGFHAVVDHRAPGFVEELGKAAPDGYDMLFENVGVRTLDPALLYLKKGARVMLCGLVQHYQDDAPITFVNFRNVLRSSIQIIPFSIYDHEDKFNQALSALVAAWQAGDLKVECTLSKGLESAPAALVALLHAQGLGKHLVQVS